MGFYGLAYIIKVEQCEYIKNPYIDGATFTHWQKAKSIFL